MLDRRGLGIDVVCDDPPSAQDDDAVHDAEDVVDVVRDEDAGVTRVARVAHEAQHALRLRDAQVVGRLVEDDEIAVEMHCSRDGNSLALAAGQCVDGGRGRDHLGDADLFEERLRDRGHCLLVHPVQESRTSDELATKEQVARDRELRHQGRILVDGLDPMGDRVRGVADLDLLATDEDVAAGQGYDTG